MHGGRLDARSAQTVTLRDGRKVCGRCVGTGVLAQRLPCGHMGVPGTLVFSDSADLSNFQCALCSPHASRPRGYPGHSESQAARGQPGAGLQMNGAT